MKYILGLALLVSVVLADPIYWTASIPAGAPGSPQPREFQSLTNIPGTSFNVLFGGDAYNQGQYSLNDTWVVDTTSMLWKQMNPSTSPAARAYHVAGATSQEVIIFGGQNEAVSRTYFNDVWRYNLTANSWKQDVFTVPSPNLARSFAAGLLVGDSLYVFGGFVSSQQKVFNDLWSYNITSKVWSLHSQNGRSGAPMPRQGHSAVYLNDTTHGPSIIYFGGYNGTGGMSDTWQYVINGANWVQITKDNDPMGPTPRWGHSAFITSNPTPTIVIFGGSFVGGAINPYYNDVWYLYPVSGGAWNWTEALPDGDEEGPQRRGGHSTVLSLGRAFTFGGYALFIGFLNDLWELVNFL